MPAHGPKPEPGYAEPGYAEPSYAEPIFHSPLDMQRYSPRNEAPVMQGKYRRDNVQHRAEMRVDQEDRHSEPLREDP